MAAVQVAEAVVPAGGDAALEVAGAVIEATSDREQVISFFSDSFG